MNSNRPTINALLYALGVTITIVGSAGIAVVIAYGMAGLVSTALDALAR